MTVIINILINMIIFNLLDIQNDYKREIMQQQLGIQNLDINGKWKYLLELKW